MLDLKAIREALTQYDKAKLTEMVKQVLEQRVVAKGYFE